MDQDALRLPERRVAPGRGPEQEGADRPERTRFILITHLFERRQRALLRLHADAVGEHDGKNNAERAGDGAPMSDAFVCPSCKSSLAAWSCPACKERYPLLFDQTPLLLRRPARHVAREILQFSTPIRRSRQKIAALDQLKRRQPRPRHASTGSNAHSSSASHCGAHGARPCRHNAPCPRFSTPPTKGRRLHKTTDAVEKNKEINRTWNDTLKGLDESKRRLEEELKKYRRIFFCSAFN